MNNKGEFKLSNFLIGIILFSTVVGGLSLIYGNLGSTYEITVDNSINDTYSKIQVIDNTTMDMAGDIRGKDIGTFDAFFLAGKSILSSARIVYNSFGVVTSMGTSLTDDLGIPPLFTIAITSIVLVLLTFAIISLWARYRS